MGRKIAIIIVIVLVVFFAFVSFKWIKHRIEYAMTNAVFVESDNMSNLSFYRVSGKIKELYKNEGDYVKKGEILAKLDDKDYKLQLDAIDEKIKSLQFKKEQLKHKLNRITDELNINEKIANITYEELKKNIDLINQNLKEIDLQINQLKKDKDRYERLLSRKLIPVRKYEDIKLKLDLLKEKRKTLLTKLEQLNISLQKAEQNITLSKVKKKQIKEIKSVILSLDSNIKELLKKKKDVENILQYTVLKAPFEGVIAKRFVSVGDTVRAGIPIYSEIEKNSFYIKVLLEETKLEGVEVGNKAKITLDAYPDMIFEGIVEEISPASAAKFALVPRDISAGEFTKVAQRIPIKIKITKGDFSVLRVGLGGEVEIKRTKKEQ